MDVKPGINLDASIDRAKEALAVDWESIKTSTMSALYGAIDESVSNVSGLEPLIEAIAEDIARYAARGDMDTLETVKNQAKALGLIIASREAHTVAVTIETVAISLARMLVGILGSVAGIRPA